MATVSPKHLGGGYTDLDTNGNGELTPFVFTVQGLAIGENPVLVPGIPALNSVIPHSDSNPGYFKCDRVFVSKAISDTAVEVTALFSTDGRFAFPAPQPDPTAPNYREWDKSYRKESINIPHWRLVFQEYPIGNGQTALRNKWEYVERPMMIEWTVMSVRVKFDAGDNTGVVQALNVIDREIGKLHVFPAFPNRLWRYCAPTIASSPESATEIFVSYSWDSDPGNGSFGNPFPGRIVTAPIRLPFFNYISLPAAQSGQLPVIATQSQFPPEGGFFNPNGWQGLPGGPI